MAKTLLGLVALSVISASAVGQTPTYKVTQEVKLGGDGGWDYLYADGRAGRLYITRGSHVMVVDTSSNSVVGDIAGTTGVHGVAIAPKHGMGFTSNGGDGTVTEFDLKTLKEVKRIKVGTGPDAICYDPSSDRVFTFNGRSGDSTAIDAGTGEVAGTIKLDGRPEFCAVDGRGKLFCNIEDKSEIQEIDPKGLKVVNTWPLAPGEGPSGLACDAKDHLLFSTCDNQKMAVVDYQAGKLLGTPELDNGPDAGGFDSRYGLAFGSCGEDGTLDVFAKDSSGNWSAVQKLKTRPGARTMTVDQKTHKVYLVTAEFEAADANAQPGQRRRRRMVPGSFTLVVVSPEGAK